MQPAQRAAEWMEHHNKLHTPGRLLIVFISTRPAQSAVMRVLLLDHVQAALGQADDHGGGRPLSGRVKHAPRSPQPARLRRNSVNRTSNEQSYVPRPPFTFAFCLILYFIYLYLVMCVAVADTWKG